MRMGRRGQSTLEYVLLMVVVLLAIMAGAPRIRNVVRNQLFKAVELDIRDASTVWQDL